MKRIISRARGIATTAGYSLLSVALTAQSAFALDMSSDEITGLTPVEDLSAGDVIQRLVDILLYAAGALAIVYLIWGGLTYITAGGDAEKASKGRVAITNAIIGIAIIVGAFAIYKLAIDLPTEGTGALTN